MPSVIHNTIVAIHLTLSNAKKKPLFLRSQNIEAIDLTGAGPLNTNVENLRLMPSVNSKDSARPKVL
jgi:hypothetical protein